MVQTGVFSDPDFETFHRLLDERYFKFVEELPSNLKETALSASTFKGAPAEGPYKGVRFLSPLYTRTAWFFKGLCSDLDQSGFMSIAEAGMYFGLASMALDRLIDGHHPKPGTAILSHQAIQNRGARIYRNMFDSDSPFWQQFNRLMMENLASLGKDVAAQKMPDSFGLNEFSASAAGKVAPMVITLVALTEAIGQSDLFKPIETSFKSILVAGQLFDDILDWKMDIHDRHVTYVLTRFIPGEILKSDAWPSVAEVEEILNQKWIDVEIFDIILDWIIRSKAAVNDINCPEWDDYLEICWDIAKKHQEACIAHHLRQVIEPFEE